MQRAKKTSPTNLKRAKAGRGVSTAPCQHQTGVNHLLAWFAANARDLPWRRTLDPYAIWVSEIMLQQTQVKTVIPYWNRWMATLPTITALAQAGQDTVLTLWSGLGYYRRARNMQKAAHVIVAKHAGAFPQDYDQVLELPGIGRYTAGAICSIAFNQPQPILDGNVMRVLTRVYGIRTDPKEKQTQSRLWALAAEWVTWAADQTLDASSTSLTVSGPCSALNQSLMELGATVCLPRSPECASCPLQQECAAARFGIVDEIPALAKRVATTRLEFLTLLVQHEGRYLVRQRPEGEVNAGLWEFPTVELQDKDATSNQKRLATQCLGAKVTHLIPRGEVAHTITRYRHRIRICEAETNGAVSSAEGRWVTATGLGELALTGTAKKVWKHVA